MLNNDKVDRKVDHDSGHQVPRVGTAESHKTSNVFDVSDFIQWSLIQICPVGLGDRFFKRGGGGGLEAGVGGSRSAGSGKEIVGGSQRTALNNCLRRQSQEVLSRKAV